jgi:carbonic anhydrase/acetyltransferase-like protein (isoleucine patch superfamily)
MVSFYDEPMLIEHLGKSPTVSSEAYVAPTATVCGDVTIGRGSRILHGAAIVAEGGSVTIGSEVIVLENAVVRSTARCSARIGDNVLIGPHVHVAGATVEEQVFIATGAAIFHGSKLGARSEVRIHGVVHVNSRLPSDAIVPIGWVAVGDPAEILPPGEHDRIWSIQQTLGFPETVYGVDRTGAGGSRMPEVTRRLSKLYASFAEDQVS